MKFVNPYFTTSGIEVIHGKVKAEWKGFVNCCFLRRP